MYPATELLNTGILPGDIINAISISVCDNPGHMVGFRIAYALTSLPDLSSGFVPTTVVFGPATVGMVWWDVNANTFALSPPIVWDGVSNLVLEFSREDGQSVCCGQSYLRGTPGFAYTRTGYVSNTGAGARYPFGGMTSQTFQDVQSILLRRAILSASTLIYGVPTYGSVPVVMDSFNLTVTDGHWSNLLPTKILANSVNRPIIAAQSISVVNGTVYSGTLNLAVPYFNPAALTFTIFGQPALGSVVLVNAATGAFTYTAPNNVSFATTSFKWKATAYGADSAINATLTIQLTAIPNAVNYTVFVASGAAWNSVFNMSQAGFPNL